MSRWWSVRAGLRHDGGIGPSRDWLGVGVDRSRAGLHRDRSQRCTSAKAGAAPLRLTTERDLLLTQRLVLQPELELDAYGKDDPDKLIGSGLSTSSSACGCATSCAGNLRRISV